MWVYRLRIFSSKGYGLKGGGSGREVFSPIQKELMIVVICIHSVFDTFFPRKTKMRKNMANLRQSCAGKILNIPV